MGRVKFLLSVATGAGAAYLLDPDNGRSRRARLRDQIASRARTGMEKTKQRAEYQKGAMKGAVHDAVDEVTPDVKPDDATLLQKVRSEALGPSGVPTGSIQVIVEDGVVIFRGTIPPDASLDRLLELTSDVEGVAEIQSELITN